MRRQALSTRVPEAETSTLLQTFELRTVEHPQACSISRSFIAAPLQSTVQVRGRGGKHSPPECRRQSRARTFRFPEPFCASHCRVAASLLNIGHLHGGSVAEHSAGAWSRRQALYARVLEAATVTHLESKVQVRGCGGKHSQPECRRQSRARTFSPAAPRTFEQRQACSTSVGASWRLRGKAKCRCVVAAASTLHPSAGGRDEHEP